ncbi:MAG: V-type ATP synthase subunit I, partial [Rikenellaceae bacterium]|nr:V-type ATP synthase subunit I [Rikenellaceae bacterium]
LQTIERYATVKQELNALAKNNDLSSVAPMSDGREVFEKYNSTVAEIAEIKTQIAKLQGEADSLRVWGPFNPEQIEKIKAAGLEIHLFSSYENIFKSQLEAWSQLAAIELISSEKGICYFAAVREVSQQPLILNSAEEVKIPQTDYTEKESKIKELEHRMAECNTTILECARSRELLTPVANELKSQMQLDKVLVAGGSREAEGSLVVLEGWAKEETAQNVDEFLAAEDEIISFKEAPTIEDNPPVVLKNNKFARLFEVISNLYALPNYHATDLTPFFAPFFMMFFGFCLGDAGYGLIFVVAAAILHFKLKGSGRDVADLIFWCGLSTVLFGALTGTFFGVELAKVPALVNIKDMFIAQDKMFTVAIYVGVVQLIYAMALKAYFAMKRFGWLYGMSTIGWIMTLVATGLAMGMPVSIEGFTTSSPAYYAIMGIAAIMMFFMNSPGKNIFANFGSGLWDLYNNVTGFLGDLLSYIRLFALGICSGIIANVFNALALGMSPDIPVVGTIVAILIMVIGHGINLFMGVLGAFVHPLRLTFVEFYKNAGFEDGGRAFEPLTKEKK